ncbi:MAG: cytochrome C peroxidase, partial [Bacteroidetes bacterium]
PTLPADNPLTREGVELGRHLFFDPILSTDSTLACATCHRPERGFTAPLQDLQAPDGSPLPRKPLPLVNLAFHPPGFFFDGRAPSLRDAILQHLEDPLLMGTSRTLALQRLRNGAAYPALFRKAFPITHRNEIGEMEVGKALEQFLLTLISGTSKFDRAAYLKDGTTLSDLELEGYFHFFRESLVDHPGCSHCHTAPLLGGTEGFFNNGLDSALAPQDFPDPGRGAVTLLDEDFGEFKVPSLRNVGLRRSFMHDGRFASLEEVLEHYCCNWKPAPNLGPDIQGFSLTPEEKEALIAFLHALTDTAFLQNPAFQSPF